MLGSFGRCRLRSAAEAGTLGMKVSPTEHEGLREQSSTSAAPGRRFKVNDHSVRIPLAVVKLMRQPVSASVQEVVPRLWPRYLLGDLVTWLLALVVAAVPAAPWTQGLGPMAAALITSDTAKFLPSGLRFDCQPQGLLRRVERARGDRAGGLLGDHCGG